MSSSVRRLACSWWIGGCTVGQSERRRTGTSPVRVPAWSEFEQLKARLTQAADPFSRTEASHRLIHRTGIQIDLVPFGGVEQDGLVVWPRTGEVMNVTGLEEAYERQDLVLLSSPFPLQVVSVPRFVVEPQTLYVPLLVVTALHWLKVSAFLHASAPASAEQPM